jgi:hypothetical protein
MSLNTEMYKTSVKKNEEKGPYGRTGYGWENNIKTDVLLIDFEVVDYIHVARGGLLLTRK